jgi:ribosomal protein L29
MADKKILNEKERSKKIMDLKIELLKNPTKRKSIKREIARLLTMMNNNNGQSVVDGKKGKIKNKSTEVVK